MMRVHAFAVVALGMLTVTSWLQEEEPSAQVVPGSVEEKIIRRREFASNLESWMDQWKNGSCSLRLLVRQVTDHCELYYPAYLDMVYLMEQGSSKESCVARNMVRHLECLEPQAAQNALLLRMREELFTQYGEKVESLLP